MLIMKQAFNIYMKLVLSNTPNQPKLVDVLNNLKEWKDLFASYYIDSTSGSCCQRNSRWAERVLV